MAIQVGFRQNCRLIPTVGESFCQDRISNSFFSFQMYNNSNLTRKFIRMHPRRRVYIRFSFNLNVGLASAFLICIHHEKLLSSICHLCIFLQDEFHVKSFFSILLLNFNFLVCINFTIQNRLLVFTLHDTVLTHCLADISGLGCCWLGGGGVLLLSTS